MCPTTSQNPSHWHLSWLNKACTTRKDSESEWLAKDNPDINPITIKPETASHVAELFSWVPLPYCSPPGHPFPIKPLALSAHVSPRTIHFRVFDKSPVLGTGRGPPSCNRATWTNTWTMYTMNLLFGISLLYEMINRYSDLTEHKKWWTVLFHNRVNKANILLPSLWHFG